MSPLVLAALDLEASVNRRSLDFSKVCSEGSYGGLTSACMWHGREGVEGRGEGREGGTEGEREGRKTEALGGREQRKKGWHPIPGPKVDEDVQRAWAYGREDVAVQPMFAVQHRRIRMALHEN